MTMHEPQDEPRVTAWQDAINGEDTPPAEAESLSTEQKLQLADEQLLHALLRHRYSDSSANDEKRVDRVLKAITPKPAKPLWFRLVRASLSSAAALVLVVVLIELLLPQTTSATSDFDRVVSAFMDDGDRTYSVEFAMQNLSQPTDADTDSDPSAEQPPAAPPRHHPGPGKFPGATLYMRGSQQYVFQIKLPRDQSVWIGQDGKNSWAVRPGGAVLVSPERDAFRIPFFEEMTTIPLIDVRDTLKAARQGYTLEAPQKVTMDDGRQADYFVARREGQVGRHPQRIELWADPNSGLLYRLVCSEMHFGGMDCRQLRMNYLNGNTLAANWFEYQGHAPAGAEVKTVTKKDIQQFRRKHHERRQERWKNPPHRRMRRPGQGPSDHFAPPPRPEEESGQMK